MQACEEKSCFFCILKTQYAFLVKKRYQYVFLQHKNSDDIFAAAVFIALYPVAGLFHLLALQSIYFLSSADIYLTAMEELLCAR
jgi:hypothetical protein